MAQLPCDGDGICMLCKSKTTKEDTVTCRTCVTPWHINCLTKTLDYGVVDEWECPDCSPNPIDTHKSVISTSSSSRKLIAAIRAIENDKLLTEQEKAKRRQDLMSGGVASLEKKKASANGDVFDILDGSFNCSFCMQLLDRPVTTPCGHNFCLKCFQKWTGQGKRTCVKCRGVIPSKMASQPRINSAIVAVIRMAKISKLTPTSGLPKVQHFVHNQDRPKEAFTTERAKYGGKANACSGKIFVTVPPDHFGPILADNDPERNQGVLVGELWEDRMECRQWGAHLPHVAGIAGQSDYGAQSVALSGGYEDDEDHGEWFLYTGSGGRDLSGNKRTNKDQSFDQKFEKYNEALRVSCKKGYPVRVVRSHKEKRSSYAPETGVRYDGIYRIEKCWRKIGIQGFKVCRYLFVRCDNEPAPWTSDEHGDCPRPLPLIKELKKATDITNRKDTPSWDYEEKDGCWTWKKPSPYSRKSTDNGNPDDIKSARRGKKEKNLSVGEKLLKEFSCLICWKVMTLPLTTPCAHNFCKPCLEDAFIGQTFVRERTCHGSRRPLRTQKNVMKCPSCPTDISDFLQNPQVNRDLMDIIESLKRNIEENPKEAEEDVQETKENTETEEDVQETENTNETEEVREEEDDETQKPKVIDRNTEVNTKEFEATKDGFTTNSPIKRRSKRTKIDDERTEESPKKKLSAANGVGEDNKLSSELTAVGKKDRKTTTESTPKQTKKRKRYNGDGSDSKFVSSVQTRSMKAKQMAAKENSSLVTSQMI